MYSWSLVDYLIGIAIFLFILLVGLGIPVILLSEYLLRPIMLKGLANLFSLRYKMHNGFISNDGKRNIVSGNVGEHRIELYDYSAPNNDALETKFTLFGIPTRSKRATYFSVDDKQEVLIGKISGYYPVSKLKEKISNLQSYS